MIPLAFDGGWSDGDPGAGRLRFDSPHLAEIKNFHISSRDAASARIGPLVSSWAIGDVIAVGRPGTQNVVIGWVIGPVENKTTYYSVPVSIRSATGSFADSDGINVAHQSNVPVIAADVRVPAQPTRVVKEPEPAPAVDPALMSNLQAENAALLAIINDLANDTTQVILPNG